MDGLIDQLRLQHLVTVFLSARYKHAYLLKCIMSFKLTENQAYRLFLLLQLLWLGSV